MMSTVPHVTSGSGLGKFQADEFLFDRVYMVNINGNYYSCLKTQFSDKLLAWKQLDSRLSFTSTICCVLGWRNYHPQERMGQTSM